MHKHSIMRNKRMALNTCQFTLFQNFADSCLQNDPFFLISRIRASPWKNTPFFAKMGTSIRSALVQIMACRLFSTKSLSKPMLGVNWTLRNTLHWNFNQTIKLFFHENASENTVWGMPAISILSGGGGRVSKPQRKMIKRKPCAYILGRNV